MIALVNQAFENLGVEEIMTQIAFIMPKIMPAGQNLQEDERKMQTTTEQQLLLVNQAYKLQNLTDRFYVLLIAMRKFV